MVNAQVNLQKLIAINIKSDTLGAQTYACGPRGMQALGPEM